MRTIHPLVAVALVLCTSATVLTAALLIWILSSFHEAATVLLELTARSLEETP